MSLMIERPTSARSRNGCRIEREPGAGGMATVYLAWGQCLACRLEDLLWPDLVPE